MAVSANDIKDLVENIKSQLDALYEEAQNTEQQEKEFLAKEKVTSVDQLRDSAKSEYNLLANVRQNNFNHLKCANSMCENAKKESKVLRELYKH